MPNIGDINNPKGKGGFGDNPENRASGRWSKDTSISYWYNHLIRLNVKDFESFEPETIAQKLAYNSILESQSDLPYLKEVTDRTEGRAAQSTDVTTNGKDLINTAIEVKISRPLEEEEDGD